jgi:two-component system chemotaxis sensor kinase CheA
MDIDTKEYLKNFVSEALDTLDETEPMVEQFSESDNADAVNAVFRAFHTLKGLAGFFGLATIQETTHVAETLLDVFRESGDPRSEEEKTLVYNVFDYLRDAVAQVGERFTDKHASDAGEAIVARLKKEIAALNPDTLEEFETKAAPKRPPSEAAPHADVPSEEDELVEQFHAADERDDAPLAIDLDMDPEDAAFGPANNGEIAEELDNLPIDEKSVPADFEFESDVEQLDESSFDDAVTRDAKLRFIADAATLIEECENHLLEIESDYSQTGRLEEVFGSIHNVKGNAEFLGFREIVQLTGRAEDHLAPTLSGKKGCDSSLTSTLFAHCDELKDLLSVRRVQIEASDDVKALEEKKTKLKKSKATRKRKEKSLESETAEPTPDKPRFEEKAAVEQSDKSKTAKDDDAGTTRDVVEKFAARDRIITKRKDIRVDTDKLDELFNLVGELITVESMVVNNQDLQGMDLPNFARSANMLEKVIRDLQETTLSIRMTPLEGVFNRMKRLVRDLSIKFGKKTSLRVTGAETEMDKNVIEEIGDPLVHILRNAIDHGLEAPEEREKKGKPAEGRIRLGASYDGNEILIVVEDDGAGLNKEKILERAADRGLVEKNARLADYEIWNLVFEPGFSTAEKVTDVSGRGVGMDVVKRNVERLRGRITVESEKGKGTKIGLHIPLTLAIMEGMLVRVGGGIFALPMLSIQESFRPSIEEVTATNDGIEMVRVRENLYPVARLHEIYNFKPDQRDLDKGILVMIEARERKLCLFVDDILGQRQIVVKPLPAYMGDIKGVTGCMALDDGDIGLILDVDSLIRRAEQ